MVTIIGSLYIRVLTESHGVRASLENNRLKASTNNNNKVVRITTALLTRSRLNYRGSRVLRFGGTDRQQFISRLLPIFFNNRSPNYVLEKF